MPAALPALLLPERVSPTPRRARLRVLGLTSSELRLPEREQLARAAQALPATLSAAPPMVVISTCHRLEILWCGGGPSVAPRIRALLTAAVPEAAQALRERRGPRAVRHLFRLALGLDSPVAGEREVAGQVRRSWLAARVRGETAPLLDRAIGAALDAASRANATEREAATSVAAEAVALARRTVEHEGPGTRLVILGAGEVARGARRAACAAGWARVTIIARDPERAARELPAGAAVRPWGDRSAALAAADVVLVATSSDHAVLAPEDLAARVAEDGGVASDRAARPLLVLDLAMPRNVDPRVAELAGVRLLDVDDVLRARTTPARPRLAERRRHLKRELARFRASEATRTAARDLARLHADGQALAAEEIARTLAALNPADAADPAVRAALEELAERISRRLLYWTSRTLREVAVSAAS